ncbi:MAG: transcription initiation factor IIB [Candidatus Helarchaeota archaeon]
MGLEHIYPMSKSKVFKSNPNFSMIDHKEQDEGIRCPECGSMNIIRDWERAELVCSSCGLVLMDSMIDTNRIARRAYTAEEKEAREHNGAPLSSMLPNYGLTTKIDKICKNRRFLRIKQWHTRLDWPRRNLLIATNEIRRLAGLLGLPKQVQEQAAILYRKVFKLKLLRGRSINSFVAACVYLSCRLTGIPRTLKELCKYSKSRPKTIRHSIHIIVRELNLKIKALNPTELISSFINKLKLHSDTERRALEIIQLGKEANIILGKDPKGVAAAAIYIACIENGERRSQNTISTATGITEVTLRNRYKELLEILS